MAKSENTKLPSEAKKAGSAKPAKEDVGDPARLHRKDERKHPGTAGPTIVPVVVEPRPEPVDPGIILGERESPLRGVRRMRRG